MRALPTVCLSLAIGLLSVSSSSAQFAAPGVALAGAAGATTCGMFTHMSPHHRDAIVRELNASAPPSSLASVYGTPNLSGRGSRQTIIEDNSNLPGAVLTAGALVSACEAAPASDSLRAAYESSNTRQRVVIGHRHR